MSALRNVERCLAMERCAWFGGKTINGNDTNRAMCKKPLPVQYKLTTAICPVCSLDFETREKETARKGRLKATISNLKGSRDSKRLERLECELVDPKPARVAMLQHLLSKHQDSAESQDALNKCADVILRSPKDTNAKRSSPHVITSLLMPRIIKDEHGVAKTIGCATLAERFRTLYSKFQLCRDLYRRKGEPVGRASWHLKWMLITGCEGAVGMAGYYQGGRVLLGWEGIVGWEGAVGMGGYCHSARVLLGLEGTVGMGG